MTTAELVSITFERWFGRVLCWADHGTAFVPPYRQFGAGVNRADATGFVLACRDGASDRCRPPASLCLAVIAAFVSVLFLAAFALAR